MTTFLIGTDGQETSEALVRYVRGRTDDDDTLYAVNSLHGGDRTSDEDIVDGERALELLAEEVGAETHQLVRGNSPQVFLAHGPGLDRGG